ncbi:cyclic diguanylate phosphodiesterase [Geobacter metallireducens GS-15]|uniref:Cyclic diguanylate phosphodiesterase n=1 Tax=Geobacter metallireducens (strain ATCC 53774 / DSM 7210 / GS-15) TaxID=269799 RepID=Q39QI6_GEOMG|nr:HD-GYP domain-containing protein [Geobacter metallireducens]ABB33488.1 cyclic diguanylate phosphodiesterase [Geobacter metallireducens GS-15]
MTDLSLAQAQRVVLLLAGTVKGYSLYPEAHPAIAQPLRETCTILEQILRGRNDVRLGIHDGVLFLEQHLFFTPTASVDELAGILTAREIRAVTFLRGLVPDELAALVALLSRRELTGGGLAAELARRGGGHVALELEEHRQEEAEEFDPSATYRQAITAVSALFEDIENGRIPSTKMLHGVVDRVADLTIREPSTLLGLAMIKDYDNYTFFHSVNVGILAMALGAAFGMGKEELRELGMAGFLHDVGKTRVAKKILNKPGKLSPEEFEVMKRHAEDGARIIDEMEGISSGVARAVLGHHLGFDRTGYPGWAKELPFGRSCEIIAVADCYDAITTLRVYKPPLTPREAVEMIRGLAGTQLNPDLVETFTGMMGRYPVGTLVRLDTNEIAVVFRPPPPGGERPMVKVVKDGLGRVLPSPVVKDLAREEGVGIVAVVDPALAAVEVSRYLE